MYMLGESEIVKRPKYGGRKPGSPNLTTAEIREVITKFAGANSGKLTRWLSEIEKQDGPKAALEAYVRVLEFALPKRSSMEVTGGLTLDLTAILARAQQTGLAGLDSPPAPLYIEHDPAKYEVADAAYTKERQAKLEQELSIPYDPTELDGSE